jgi:hypothetical protein
VNEARNENVDKLRFESTTINEMKPPKRQRNQSAKSQMTQESGPKRQKTSNRHQRKETGSYNVCGEGFRLSFPH